MEEKVAKAIIEMAETLKELLKLVRSLSAPKEVKPIGTI